MSLTHIESWRRGDAVDLVQRPRTRRSPELIHRHISRRGLLRGAAGAGMAGALGTILGGWRPSGAQAAAPGPGTPNPIPGGLDIGGTIFHVKLPGLLHPADDEPITITDFNGAFAYTVIDGMGTRTDLSSGETQQLPFEVDMRFMKGVFVGTDGRVHRGAFGLL